MRVDQESMLGSGEGQGLGSRPQPALRAQPPRAQSACDREVGPGEGEGKRAKDGMRGPNKAGGAWRGWRGEAAFTATAAASWGRGVKGQWPPGKQGNHCPPC